MFSKKKNQMVVYCADSSLVEDHARFIKDILRLQQGTYFPISLLGGASVLAHPVEMKTQYDAMVEQIETCDGIRLVDVVHLVAHKGCKFCLSKLGPPPADADDREKDHLLPAAQAVRLIVPKAVVVGHYATPGRDKLAFDSKKL